MDSLFIVLPNFWSLFCYEVFSVLSNFAIISLIFVFLVSCGCCVSFLFLSVPWFGLQCVIVAFPAHTHLFF